MDIKPLDDLAKLELGKLMRQMQKVVEELCGGDCGVVFVAKKANSPSDAALILSELQPEESAIILHGALGIIQAMLFENSGGLEKERQLEVKFTLEVTDEPPEDGTTIN